MRITPAGHEVSWHAINMHKLLDHMVVDFPQLCGNPIGMSFFALHGLESKHSSTKQHRDKHGFTAAPVVSKIHNKATLGLRSQTRHDRSNLMRGGLLRASDASLARKMNMIDSRALRARRSKNSRLASLRCRTQGLDSRIDWATGESTPLLTPCAQRALITGASASLVKLMSPDETEAAEGAAGERVGEVPGEEEDTGATAPTDTPPAEHEEEDTEHDESETEAELEALIEAEPDGVRVAELRGRLLALTGRLDEAANSRRAHSGYLMVHLPGEVQPEPPGSGSVVIGVSVVRSTRMADVHIQGLIKAHGMKKKATTIAAQLETVGRLRDLSAAELQKLHKDKGLPGVGLPWLRTLHAALRAVDRLDPPRALAAPVPAPQETAGAEEPAAAVETAAPSTEETAAPMAAETAETSAPETGAPETPETPETPTVPAAPAKRSRVPNPRYYTTS